MFFGLEAQIMYFGSWKEPGLFQSVEKWPFRPRLGGDFSLLFEHKGLAQKS
jgi:hypothetical protein